MLTDEAEVPIEVLVVAGATVIERLAVAVTGVASESVTPTVKGYVPPVVGVPLSVPLEASSESPGGSEPVVTAQL